MLFVLEQPGTILGADRGVSDLPINVVDLSCDSCMRTLKRTKLRMPLEPTKRARRRRIEVVGSGAVEERSVARAAFDVRWATATRDGALVRAVGCKVPRLLLSSEPAPQLLHGTCPPVNLLATGVELEPLEKLGRRGWNFGALP